LEREERNQERERENSGRGLVHSQEGLADCCCALAAPPTTGQGENRVTEGEMKREN